MKLEQVLEVIQFNCQLAHNLPVVVGVSGGPDSLCLLNVLARLKFPVIAAHFDHRLRPESEKDAAVVQAAAAALNVPVVIDHQDVRGYAGQRRLSLEEAARILRYQFLFDQAKRYSAQAVAVGHTASDQVETVLMHILRGTGLSGLKGMSFRTFFPSWDEHIPLVRPLLLLSREETLAYCEEHGLSPVFDLSNQDSVFFRNRIRNELIPFLETFNPQFQQAVLRMARILTDDDAVLQDVLAQAWQRCRPRQERESVSLSAEALLSLAPALQRGVLRKAAALVQPELRNLDYSAVERGLQWAAGPGSGQVDLVQGLRLVKEGAWLSVRNRAPAPDEAWPYLLQPEMELLAPGEVDLAPGWRMASAWQDAASAPTSWDAQDSHWEAWLDADALSGPLRVRRPQPGDRFQPLGMGGHSLKLSDFWINHKVPRRARLNWPLLVSGDQIIWLPGFQPAHSARLQEKTRRALVVRLFRV